MKSSIQSKKKSKNCKHLLLKYKTRSCEKAEILELRDYLPSSGFFKEKMTGE